MENREIEIGIKLIASIYLKVDEELPTVPFDVDNIVDVYSESGNTIVLYHEKGDGYLSCCENVPFMVLDSVEDVKKAVKEAREYKIQGLNAIVN